MNKVTASVPTRDIVAYLEELGQVVSVNGAGALEEPGLTIGGVSTDAEAGPGELAWSKRPAAGERFAGSLLICSPEALGDHSERPAQMVIVCDRPRPASARVVGRFFAELAADRAPTYVDPATAIFVERARAWVMNATVGRNVRIGPLATIGCSGMGHERDEQGRLVPFPQLGGVLLEDDTDIAVQAMIKRGAIGDTLVRRGAKIAPHVNVGHSVEVGEDALVTGHAQIGGGARIGARAAVWQSVAIANGVTIGEGAVVGMGAMIREDIGPGEGWAGNPGRRLR